MTQADKHFIDTCKKIITEGYSSEGTGVRTRWEDGSEANYFSIVGVTNVYDVGKEFPMITLRNNSQTEAKKQKGIEKLQKQLKNNISAFSGNSGVGKSTLINGIFKRDITQEGEISKRNRRGKNTTTAIKLYEINENTYIADTPGFSTFDISEIPSQELENYFVEFEREKEKCEFIGCTHIKEKKCGVKQAIEEGT